MKNFFVALLFVTLFLGGGTWMYFNIHNKSFNVDLGDYYIGPCEGYIEVATYEGDATLDNAIDIVYEYLVTRDTDIKRSDLSLVSEDVSLLEGDSIYVRVNDSFFDIPGKESCSYEELTGPYYRTSVIGFPDETNTICIGRKIELLDGKISMEGWTAC